MTLIIFLFLRSFRSTLIVCTSIPISVVGTFALLYFAGYTLNIMTFGGLALGIGMVVDAAIVVLENAYRHMEHGKDRVTAAIEGSEEVWGAIVASILTHIAVFVPLLFLTGISSILFKQLSVVVIFSLLMSLLVAVTLVPVLCAYLLKLPPPVEERKGLGGRLFTQSEKFLEGMDDAYRRFLHKALAHRPMVIGVGAASVVAAVLMFPLLNTELAPQTDEGVVQVSAELAAGHAHRAHRRDHGAARADGAAARARSATTIIASAGSGGGGGGGGFGGGGTSRGSIQLFLVPKDQRERSSDQIAFDLRRQLAGIPGRHRAGQRERRQQPAQPADVGRRRTTTADAWRVEIRGEDLEAGRRLAQEVQDLLQTTPGIADPRLARDEARPELAVQVDRPKAALFGLNTTQVANTIRTNVAGTTAAQFRQGGYEYPIIVRLKQEDREQVSDVNDVMVNTGGGVSLPVRNVMMIQSQLGPSQIERKNQERMVRSAPSLRFRSARRCGRHRAPAGDQPSAGLFDRVRRRSRAAGKDVQRAAARADPRAHPRLCRHGVAVRVAARPVHHHVLGADGGDRRRARALPDEHVVQPSGVSRRHHARRDRRQQRDSAGGLHEHSAAPRRHGAARGGRGRRAHAAAADSDDVARDACSASSRWRWASAKAASCRSRWRASSSAGC